MLPYDYCINQLDTEDLINSALDPGLQHTATNFLVQHDEGAAATDPGLLRAANAYLACLDIDKPPSNTGLELPNDDSYALTAVLVHMILFVRKQDGDRCLACQEVQQTDSTWYTDVRAHVDGGSMASTSDDETLIWYAQLAVNPPVLRVADKRPH